MYGVVRALSVGYLGWIPTQALLSNNALSFTCICFISYTCWAFTYWQIWFVNILLKKTIPQSQELLDLFLTVKCVHWSGSGSTGLMWAAACLLLLFGGFVIDFLLLYKHLSEFFNGTIWSLWSFEVELTVPDMGLPQWGFSLKVVCSIGGFMHIAIELSTVIANPLAVCRSTVSRLCSVLGVFYLLSLLTVTSDFRFTELNTVFKSSHPLYYFSSISLFSSSHGYYSVCCGFSWLFFP